MDRHFFTSRQPLQLEAGGVLPVVDIAYHTYGTMNADRSNVVWLCHALTANSDVCDWWDSLCGIGKAIDPEKYFIVCANIIGSCYGSTGPLSVNPETGQPWYSSFPMITIRDMVNAHIALRRHLGIERVALLAGGSMGGYQVLEWVLIEPDRIGKMLLTATSPRESAWGIAIHTAQRLAIEADPTWKDNSPAAGAAGLKAARAIGMLTYRNYGAFVETQTDEEEKLDHFKASSYIDYQGDKLVKRFNAHSYRVLGKAMDSHNIARGRGRMEAVLGSIVCPTLIIGISSDQLCPVQEQRFMAQHIPGCIFHEIDSPYGHDGFLIEGMKIGNLLNQMT